METIRQPMMSEVHDLYVRFTRVQAQLQPLVDSYSTFLAQDPAFTSTNVTLHHLPDLQLTSHLL